MSFLIGIHNLNVRGTAGGLDAMCPCLYSPENALVRFLQDCWISPETKRPS